MSEDWFLKYLITGTPNPGKWWDIPVHPVWLVVLGLTPLVTWLLLWLFGCFDYSVK